MDKTASYIQMSQMARELQLYKYELGFQPGDYIWDGTQVRVIGNDWIPIENHWRTEGRPFFEFAVMEELTPLSYYQDTPMENIICKRERLIIQTLGGIGLWLPRQDQLQEMSLSRHGQHNPKDGLDAVFDILGNQVVACKSFEQLWLRFTMFERYRKSWNGEDWICLNHPNT